MTKYLEIYCLNKRHSGIVCRFLRELEDIVEECTLYSEDLKGFKDIIENFIIFHNDLAIPAIKGDVCYENWYLSLPNNVYWATMGYFASLTLKDKSKALFFKEKVLSLIENTIKSLDRSLVIQPFTEIEGKMNLN